MADVREIYRARLGVLQFVANRLQERARAALDGLAHIDRLSFREKAVESFARKSVSLDDDGLRRYSRPLSEIEDQVAGRVLVFFRRDIDPVVGRLRSTFSHVEYKRRAPERYDSFSYESDHMVFMIPPDAQPAGWSDMPDMPNTFEMQVRTLFMHAWAEPQHDLGYKPGVPLEESERRRLAWAASNAWGGDEIFEQVLESIASRT
jgi:putative GTP pyrophosphokinase